VYRKGGIGVIEPRPQSEESFCNKDPEKWETFFKSRESGSNSRRRTSAKVGDLGIFGKGKGKG